MIQDAWKNFELSGKVSDYLNYRQSTGLSSDRHGIKYNADWRV